MRLLTWRRIDDLGAETGSPPLAKFNNERDNPLSAKRLRSFLSRPLDELDLRVVCIDGKVFRDHCMVVALGIDTQGRKHVLEVAPVPRRG